MLQRKLAVIGDPKCGKTSLIRSICGTQDIPDAPYPGPDGQYPHVNVDYGNTDVDLALADTNSSLDGPDARFRGLAYSQATVVLLCFAIDSPESLENIKQKWIPEAMHFCRVYPKILVGCKADLRDVKGLDPSKLVTMKKVEQVQKRADACAYLECSSMTQQGIEELSEKAARTAASFVRGPIYCSPGGKKCIVL